MSPAQKEAYEENKLKMRKAIADPALADETEQVWEKLVLRRVKRGHFHLVRYVPNGIGRCLRLGTIAEYPGLDGVWFDVVDAALFSR